MSEKKKSLVEQALLSRKTAIGTRLAPEDKEEIDLFVAWIDGTLETSDVKRVLGLAHAGSVCTRAGTCLRHGVLGGYLKITKQEPV